MLHYHFILHKVSSLSTYKLTVLLYLFVGGSIVWASTWHGLGEEVRRQLQRLDLSSSYRGRRGSVVSAIVHFVLADT